MKKSLVCTAFAAAIVAAVPAVAQTAGTPPQAESAPAGKDVPVVQVYFPVTREAAQAKVAEHFARLDADKDGFVTQAEAAAADRAMKDRRQDGQAATQGSGAGMPGFGSSMLERADANEDGRMSLAEAHAMGLHYFDRVDADRDGTITGDERRQFRKQLIDERRPG